MTTHEPLTDTIRNCIRVLEMVAILHHRGYERLRIEPGMAPSGMYWRCGSTHAGNMDPGNGILCLKNRDHEEITYTSGMEWRLFDWGMPQASATSNWLVVFKKNFRRSASSAKARTASTFPVIS
jgi:hypothetical protein